MLTVCIRTLLLYLIVLFALRVMGKSELSKLSTFQLVVLIMIAELASIPIDTPSASLIKGSAAILTLMFLQVFISYMSIKSEKLKNFINGSPSLLIDKGMLNVKEMERLRITVNELFEQIRIAGTPSLSDVEYAVLEANGQLSVISKSQQEKMPMIMVSDGTIYEQNLEKAGITYDTLLCMIEAKGIADPSDIFVAFYDGNRLFHVYPRPGSKQTFSREIY